jgi:large subunit ribosomal protein L22
LGLNVEVAARLRHVRLSPQKCRLVADQIRRKSAAHALQTLTFSVKKAARILKKVLESAIANAEHNVGLDVDQLRVSIVLVDQGPSYKRLTTRAKGRSSRILKPTCHITIKVSDRGNAS